MSNLINELGELALSTRLMRLSEGMRKDVTRIYNEHGIDFESKWFPVLYVLSKRSPLNTRSRPPLGRFMMVFLV